MAQARARAKKAAPKKTSTKKSTARRAETRTAKRSTKAAAKKPAATAKKATAKASMNGATDASMLEDFFKDELKDIYWAEKHLVKTLPKMQKAATSEDLKNAIAEHLEQTKEHVARLEEVFALMGQKPQAKKCDAMMGITEEGAGILEETEKGTYTRDVGIILAAQKVEHYEIATYGGLAQLAKTIGRNDVAELLGTTLEEEKEADMLLTQIAEAGINEEAAEEEEEGEEDEEAA